MRQQQKTEEWQYVCVWGVRHKTEMRQWEAVVTEDREEAAGRLGAADPPAMVKETSCSKTWRQVVV